MRPEPEAACRFACAELARGRGAVKGGCPAALGRWRGSAAARAGGTCSSCVAAACRVLFRVLRNTTSDYQLHPTRACLPSPPAVSPFLAVPAAAQPNLCDGPNTGHPGKRGAALCCTVLPMLCCVGCCSEGTSWP